LQTLKNAGLKLGLATAADFSNADFTVDAIDIRKYFDCIVTSDIVKEGKPSPAVYLHAAQVLNVQPENCVVFEDTVSGIKAGAAAGMQVVGITTGMSVHEMQTLPVAKIISDYQSMTIEQISTLIPA
jgi:HAD superfamily hydrolase (TIGR01509 family)